MICFVAGWVGIEEVVEVLLGEAVRSAQALSCHLVQVVPGEVVDPLVWAGGKSGDDDGIQQIFDGSDAQATMVRGHVKEGTHRALGQLEAGLDDLPHEGVCLRCPGPVDGGGAKLVCHS